MLLSRLQERKARISTRRNQGPGWGPKAGRAGLGNSHRTTYPKIGRKGRTAGRETRLGRSVGPCKTYGFLFFYPGPGGSGSPRKAPPHKAFVALGFALLGVTSRECGSTFPDVDPHFQRWIHISKYGSTCGVTHIFHRSWWIPATIHTGPWEPPHTRTGAPGPGLRASPGLTRYSYPRAFHVLRFPGPAGFQWLGSQFDLQR